MNMECCRDRWRARAAAKRRPTGAVIGSIVAATCMTLKVTAACGADEVTEPVPADVSGMTLEDLTNIEISSVSKRPERLLDAAASVYLISREDIRRSGSTSIPEILRLAPNLQVARVDSSQYAISARGFNSTAANKLLVLIDGRSVYTPLFSGVFWDVQDTMIADIERIEVISGPGGTLWGANAVNGVINIITRHTRDTKGGLASADAGNEERGAGARYGGRLGEAGAYRLYAKAFERDDTVTESGASRQDSWEKGQAGFRLDWSRNRDELVLQGDAYDGSIDQRTFDDKSVSGGNLLAGWSKTLAGGSTLQVRAYYDQTRRRHPGAFGEVLHVYDVEVQHRFNLGGRHDIVWGGGYRYSRDSVTNSAALAFLPAKRDLTLANVLVQDSVALGERLKLTVGVKLEDNTYTGLENQPNVRLAWKPNDRVLLWSAISRAVRTPSRLDRELYAPGSPPHTVLGGGPDFQSEKLTAYEIGYRAQLSPAASFSISNFYNVYDDLRSLEPAGGTTVFRNMMEGDTSGIETWGSYGVSGWCLLTAGYTYFIKDLRFKPGSGDTNVARAGNDPTHQFSARSAMTFADRAEFDIGLRSIGALPDPDVPAYVALDARLGWRVTKDFEVSLAGFNLGDERHPEFGAPPARAEIGRNIYAKILWTF